MPTNNSALSNLFSTHHSIIKFLFSIIFIFAISGGLFGQSKRIPFELHNNHIYLKTEVNGKGPYYFLFDSGHGASGSTIDAAVAESLNLPVKGYINATMIGGSKGIAYTEDVKFDIGGLLFNEKKAAFLHLKENEKEEGHQIDGLFGYSLIKNYVIEVDYQKRIITFYDPEGYKKPKNARIIPLLNVNENKVPTVNAKIFTLGKKKLNFVLIFDTGYDGNFLLGRKFIEENHLQTDATSAAALTGAGTGGNTLFKKGRIQKLQFGNIKSIKPETIFAFDEKGVFAGDHGYIGGDFLRKYTLVLNYKEAYLLLF